MSGRTLAIGDIHGCSLALDTLIEAIRPTRKDVLVTLGDYVDRGIDSKGVIERLIALKTRCQLVPLFGNHEQMLLEAREDALSDYQKYRLRAWLEFGGIATLDSFGIESPEEIPQGVLAFLFSCRDFFETESHIFVHANYHAHLALDEQPASMLRWEPLKDGLPGPHFSGKTAIVGHTSQVSGEILDIGYLKCIDTYCYGGKWLTALDVESGRVWQANERGALRR
jgi:serine/threonine protein phosphatase 1